MGYGSVWFYNCPVCGKETSADGGPDQTIALTWPCLPCYNVQIEEWSDIEIDQWFSVQESKEGTLSDYYRWERSTDV